MADVKKHPIEVLYPRPLKFLNTKLHNLVKGRLWLKVIIGLLLGVAVGFVLGPTANLISPAKSALIADWLALPGSIFLSVIQMIVIPLIFASIIKGIAGSESVKQLKKTGITVAIYFVMTSVVAIGIGIMLAMWIQPGQYINKELILAMESPVAADSIAPPALVELPTVISSVLPTNLLGSMVNGEMLQIVIFSLIFGIALVNMNVKQSRPLLELLGSLQDVCMTIVKWTLYLAPLAVFGLMAKLISQFGLSMLFGIGVYVITVLIGLLLLFIFYLVIASLSMKASPFTFMKNIRDVQLLAFSTSSSIAVMPLTMKTAEEKLRIRSAISQFVVPIGATINMDGTALYQAVATLFLAQVFDIHLGFVGLLFLIVTIIGSSIGAPGTPGVGVAILAVIMSSVGVPLSGLVLVLGVDRILDMSRTAVNVTGDLTACAFINRFVGGKSVTTQLQQQKKHEQQRKVTGQDVIVSQSLVQ